MEPLRNILPDDKAVTKDNPSLEMDQIFVEDLVVQSLIGIYEHELENTQPIKINIELSLTPLSGHGKYKLNDIVCYDQICKGIIAIIDRGHIDFIETLAEEIAALCLRFNRAQKVMVKISKPKAIKQADAAGVRILRIKNIS